MSGIPAICSRLGAMQEIVRDQQTGLQFTPGDATDFAQKVEWAWINRSEVEAMGREGRREYEERYTAEKHYEMLRQVYEGVLQSRGRPELAVDSAPGVFTALKSPGAARTNAKKCSDSEAAKNPSSPQIVV
jgi:Glycosyl transferases group 1